MVTLPAGRILIAGGGIGGLALAVALAKFKLESLVLEAKPEFGTAGAGIQLGPNGVRVLDALGIAQSLLPKVGVPQSIQVHRGTTGARLAQLPLGDWIARRHGAPYWVAHRADLHDALRTAAEQSPLVTLRTGFAVRLVRKDPDGVRAFSTTGDSETGSAIVGADGLWSSMRRFVAPHTEPAFAGACASRCVLDADKAGALNTNAVGLWLSPSAHVVHYPVRGGKEIAVVVIAREEFHSRSWEAEVERERLFLQLDGFARDLVAPLEAAPQWRRWSLQRLAPLPDWGHDRMVLIGDAAHPMVPYLAQGGVLALEDAWCLAKAFARQRGVEERAIAEFAAERQKRAARVQAASWRNGQIYHLSGVMAAARDLAFTALPGETFMKRLDWLYGWAPA